MSATLTKTATGQDGRETHERSAGCTPLTIGPTESETQLATADGDPTATGHSIGETHGSGAGCTPLTIGHSRHEPQRALADGDPLSTDQDERETQSPFVGGHPLAHPNSCANPNEGAGAPPSTPTSPEAAALGGSSPWAELRIAATLFDRAQRERIAVGNLLGLKADGDRTKNGPAIDLEIYGPHYEHLGQLEHTAKLLLRRTYRYAVPPELREWQKATPGIGEDSLARILGRLGDPYIAIPHWHEGEGDDRVLMVGEPYVRTIGQLWQYCGHGAPGRKVRGMTADQAAALGSPTLKMLVHLQAEWCMKNRNSPYRSVYDAEREATAERAHTVECVRCGPSGKPAQPGTPWKVGHQHAHALRIVGKEILRDMWLVRHHKETQP